jgi:two-component system, NarL family, sensor kinase
MNMVKKYLPALLMFLWLMLPAKIAGTPYHVEYNVSEEFTASTETIDSLIRASQGLLYADPDSAWTAAMQALKHARNQDDELWHIRAINLLGSIHEVQSVHDSALYYFFQAQAIASRLEHFEQMGNSCNNIGVTYWSIGNFKDALIYFFQALDYYELGGFEGSKATTLNNIGLIYADLDNYDQALDYYRRAHNMYEVVGDSIRMGATLTNIGTSLFHLGEPDSSLHYMSRSIDLKQQTNDKYGLCISLEGMGNIWLGLGDYSRAMEYFRKSKNLSQDIGFTYGKALSLLGLSNVYLAQGQNRQALEHANAAMKIARETGNTKMQYMAHNIISKAYDHSGDYQQALEHYRTYNALKNDALNKNRLHQVYNLEMQHAAEKNLREIARQQELLSRKNTVLAFISFTFLAVLVIIFLLYRLHMNKVRQREQLKLDAANIQLTEARARAALEAEVAERKRLGFELHDGVGPLLSLAKLNVTALLQKPQLAPERKLMILQNTEGTINEVLKEMKQISNNMAPLVLLEKGFPDAVKDLVGKLNQSSAYKVTLDMMGLNSRMEPYLEHSLYRTIQEALNNVMMHAEGTEINIQIIQNHEDLTVMIEDNGKGFDPSQVDGKKGMGLKSAASRIQSLKGELLIDSAQGRGTIITIIVPLVHKST